MHGGLQYLHSTFARIIFLHAPGTLRFHILLLRTVFDTPTYLTILLLAVKFVNTHAVRESHVFSIIKEEPTI
jgi:hypothetical protein